MFIDREKVKTAFYKYVCDYDINNVKIKLKLDHTYRVADMCDAISDDLELDAEDSDIAWISGMLHDIGRFEQLKRFNTFKDSISCDHAELSADILFKDGNIKLFTGDDRHNALIEKVIRLHNKYMLPEDLTERELMFANILRDADKIDILKVTCDTPRTEIYDLPEEAFKTASITPAVYDDVMSEHNVNRAHSATPIDSVVSHIAFVFGIVYEESLRQIKSQGYLEKIMSYESDNPETAESLATIRDKVHKYIERRLSEND